MAGHLDCRWHILPHSHQKQVVMKSRNLFLGLLVIIIGVVALLSALDVITFHWCLLWRLWPLGFVFLGVALLPTDKNLKAGLLLLTFAIGCALYFVENKHYEERSCCRFWNSLTVWNNDDDDEDNADDYLEADQHFSAPYSELESASLDVEVGACEIEIGQPCAELATADIRSNFVKYSFRTELGDRDASLFLSGKGHTKNLKGKNENEVNIALNQQPLWNFKLDMGAADADLDFTPYRVSQIEINGGACDIDLKLGDSGCDTQVDISTGVSDIDIKVPQGVDCEIQVESAITDKDFTGFEKIEKGLWRTPDFGKSASRITLHLSCAVSDITVKRY